jgi:hypothetical protein
MADPSPHRDLASLGIAPRALVEPWPLNCCYSSRPRIVSQTFDLLLSEFRGRRSDTPKPESLVKWDAAASFRLEPVCG